MSTTTPPIHGSYLMPTLAHATVADAMHPGILSCPPDAPLTEVARMMASHHVHSVAVVGVSHDHGEKLVWGIISDLDLMRAGVRGEVEATAGSMALQPIVSVEPTMPLREAGELMLTHELTHVAVVDPGVGRPVAILSTLDIAGILAWGEA